MQRLPRPATSGLLVALLATALLAPSMAPVAQVSPPPHRERLLVIGDSVLAGVLANHALGQLQDALPGWEVVFDAAADRSTAGGADVVLADDPASFDMVIVGLGTNNGWSAKVFAEQARQLLEDLKPVAHVYWLTVHEVHRFQRQYAAVNFVIRGLADQYANLQAVDWNAFGAQHPEAFYGDGLHLAPVGSKEMATFLATLVNGTNAYLLPRSPSAVTTTTRKGRASGPAAVTAPRPPAADHPAHEHVGGELWWLIIVGAVVVMLSTLVVLRRRKVVRMRAARARARPGNPRSS